MTERSEHFGDALILRVRSLGHPLCAGLDPHLERIPGPFRTGDMEPSDPRTAESVERFLLAFVERVAARVAAFKPQIAFFEQLGWRGIRVLESVVARARGLGVPVILDAKRGDIESTAEGYARAYLSAAAPQAVDAITLNPYLGRDTLEPFVACAARQGRGLFVLVKTSNPGSGDYQDRHVEGRPLYELVAESLAEIEQRLLGPQTDWSSLGIVVGATYPETGDRLRALLPRSLFLVPGYGAQGASAADAVRGFVRGPGGLEGGVVNSSRGLLFPRGAEDSDAVGWEKAIDAALDEATRELSEAVRL